MALHVDFLYIPGFTLTFAVARLADRFNYDFADSTFKNTTPATLTMALPSDTLHPGVYSFTLAQTPDSQFHDGDYLVYVMDSASGSCVGMLGTYMKDGDDGTVISSSGGGVFDDPYVRAYCYGNVIANEAEDSYTIYDEDDPTRKRLKFWGNPNGDRIVTKEPT